jgi:hypothetical protein
MITLIILSIAGCVVPGNTKDKASSDFLEKAGMVQIQQQNIATSLNLTAGKMLDQPTLKSVLDTQRPMITELIMYTDNATASGSVYLTYLKPGDVEYSDVSASMKQMTDYVNASVVSYNSGVDMYNQFWGGVNGTMSRL